MGKRKRRRADQACRPPMWSPGRQSVALRDHRQWFWAGIALGLACEHATLEHLDWFNQLRLRTELGMVSPAEFEAAHYLDEDPALRAVSH